MMHSGMTIVVGLISSGKTQLLMSLKQEVTPNSSDVAYEGTAKLRPSIN
jgi:type IV secretory pathway ATPase VirB11/archaellum biosynthesis ATPase